MSSFDPPPPRRADDPNPYAAPGATIGEEPIILDKSFSDDEATRRQYLNHEASVKAIGGSNYLGGVICLVIGGLVLREVVIVFFAVAALSFAVGWGLRRLQPWARWTEVGLMVLQMPVQLLQKNANPVPVLIAIYILYLMLSRKSAVVFSQRYKEVIARTPHIRYQVSLVVKVLVVILLLVLGLAAIGVIISAINRR